MPKNISLDELKAQAPDRKGNSPLEVTLYEGINFNMVASSIPVAYGRDKTSDKPGMKIVGYVHEVTDKYMDMSPDKLESGQFTNLGGWQIINDAIHHMRQYD